MGIKTIIDKSGKIIIDAAWQKRDGQFSNCAIGEGEQAVDYLCSEEYRAITNEQEHFFLKPHWDGTKWVELATEQELQAAYPSIAHIPSLEERMGASEAAIKAIMGGTQNV